MKSFSAKGIITTSTKKAENKRLAFNAMHLHLEFTSLCNLTGRIMDASACVRDLRQLLLFFLGRVSALHRAFRFRTFSLLIYTLFYRQTFNAA